MTIFGLFDLAEGRTLDAALPPALSVSTLDHHGAGDTPVPQWAPPAQANSFLPGGVSQSPFGMRLAESLLIKLNQAELPTQCVSPGLPAPGPTQPRLLIDSSTLPKGRTEFAKEKKTPGRTFTCPSGCV